MHGGSVAEGAARSKIKTNNNTAMIVHVRHQCHHAGGHWRRGSKRCATTTGAGAGAIGAAAAAAAIARVTGPATAGNGASTAAAGAGGAGGVGSDIRASTPGCTTERRGKQGRTSSALGRSEDTTIAPASSRWRRTEARSAPWSAPKPLASKAARQSLLWMVSSMVR
jgi:hypothetical protein